MDHDENVPTPPAVEDAISVIDPGPAVRTLLTLQDRHISTNVWNAQSDPTARDRVINVRHAATHDHSAIPEDIHPWLIQAGFYHVARLRNHEIDHHLISALVERWRPETRTFHMSMGEVTITLEDVHHLLGLPTDGDVVSGRHGRHNFRELVGDLLGVQPDADRDLHGSLLGLHFLRQHFGVYAVHADTEVGRLRYTRALILRILGGMLFVDTSSSFVPARYLLFLDDFERTGSFSWGSAVLACLYRELCRATRASRRDMGGCALLLQLWAWTRFPTISPSLPRVDDQDAMMQEIYGNRFNVYQTRQTRFSHIRRYRHHMDVMRRRDIRWRPYDIVDRVHPPDVEMARRWLAVCPLICYENVVYQQPDRVLRQFGYDQHIPSDPINCSELLTITAIGKSDVDWRHRHRFFISQWDNRDDLVVQDLPPMRRDGYLSVNSEYMQWYFTVTRRWMTQRAAFHAHVTDRAETIVHMASSESQAKGAFDMRQVYDEAVRLLVACDDLERVTDPGEFAPPPIRRQTESPPPVVRTNRRARHEGLPLHHSAPAVADRPVVLSAIPPRPPGIFYAPGYPAGTSQQYYWPPNYEPGSSSSAQHSFPPSQYPPWFTVSSMPQPGFVFTAYPMCGSTPTTPAELYRPAQPTPDPTMGFTTPVAQMAPPMSSPGFDSFVDPITDFLATAMQDRGDGGDDDEAEDPDRLAVRRNPVRGARHRCHLSPYEHDMSRCAGYHGDRDA